MKPALLNSIYHKVNADQDIGGLKDLVDLYAKKIFILYLNSLNKAGINHLDEKIKVTTKFDDGYVLTNTFKAGEHMIEAIFDSEEYQREIKKLDDTFLSNCQCPNKESILNKLKFVIMEIGSESIKQDEWLNELQGWADCKDFEDETED